MAEDKKKQNLGRGLSALLGDDDGADYAELDRVRESKTVPIELLHPSRYQPRHDVDDRQIKDLSQSISEKGILQPILVRRRPDEANAFEIIAGERRWRAAQMAQLHEVPVIIRELDDREVLEVALVENLQRQDLSPLEEAEGYRRLMEEFTHTQADLAKAVGKSRSHVANMMRLLGLPDPVKDMLQDTSLSIGHARALLNAKDPAALARKVARRGLNVRQTEKLVQDESGRRKSGRKAVERDADTLALERDLSNLLGMKVEIRFQGVGGTLLFHYQSLEQLDDVLHRLSHGSGAGATLEGEREGEEDVPPGVTPPVFSDIQPGDNDIPEEFADLIGVEDDSEDIPLDESADGALDFLVEETGDEAEDEKDSD